MYLVLIDIYQFIINSLIGIVYIVDQLDREFKVNYFLKIEVRDKVESGQQLFFVVILKIFLDDVNDCFLVFIFSSYSVKVFEDFFVGIVIVWFEIQDFDFGLGG